MELPRPRQRGLYTGASGAIYQRDVYGASEKVRFIERIYSSEHEARITLQSGRTVLLRLHGLQSASNDADAVITIHIDDDEVATWSPEKILSHAELTGEWLCWDKHWDEDGLKKQAQLDAEKVALESADVLPKELQKDIERMSPAQRSESALHYAIKMILETASEIVTPEYENSEVIQIEEGWRDTQRYRLESMRLALSNVRLENRLGNIVPDILCQARDSRGVRKPCDLLIEVAVTHKVDEVKRRKIVSAGLTCLEIDVGLFRKEGFVAIDVLREIVIERRDVKRWVSHPAIQEERSKAISILNKRRLNHQEHQRVEYENQQRLERLKALPMDEALEHFRTAVTQRWNKTETRTDVGPLWTVEDVARVLAEKGYTELSSDLFCEPLGIVWYLERIKNAGQIHQSPYSLVNDAYKSRSEIQRYVTLLCVAASPFESFMSNAERQKFEAIKSGINLAWTEERDTYARPHKYDRILELLYPNLRAYITSKKGTVGKLYERSRARMSREREAKQKEADRVQRIKDEQASAESERRRVAEQARAKALKEKKNLEVIGEFSRGHEWSKVTKSWPTSLEALIDWLGKKMPSAIASVPLIRSAWAARDCGVTLHDWLNQFSSDPNSDIPSLTLLLKSVFMISHRWDE